MSQFADRFIYVVDDDDGVRESTIELMASAGIEARGFSSARDFLETFDAGAACILLDLHMPHLSGFSTLEILRRRGNTVPVVLFSGRSDAVSNYLASLSGVTAFLTKPVEHNQLIGLVSDILRSEA